MQMEMQLYNTAILTAMNRKKLQKAKVIIDDDAHSVKENKK